MSDTTKNIIYWYKKNIKNYPWRKSNNPYQIWISEIMLQQTRVSTAIPFYNNWLVEFPTIHHVAKSNLATILKAWEGLGYYKRAENIYKSSKIIIKEFNGLIPENYDLLISLKGIGDYTASAILSIAYNKQYCAIDGNLKRILSRFFTIPPNQQTLQIFKKYGIKILSKKYPGECNQALMDIGREICLPNHPKCTLCPLNTKCKAYLLNKVLLYPQKTKIKKIPSYDVVTSMIFKKNKFLICQRPPNGLLANMWELPGGKIKNNETEKECIIREIMEETNLKINTTKKIGIIKHQYSHFKVRIVLFTSKYNSGACRPLASQKIKWIAINQINNYTFPKGTHKLFNLYSKNAKIII